MIDASKINALFDEGVSSMRTDDYDAAIENFEKMLKIDRRNIEAAYHLGLCYTATSEFDKALEIFDRIMGEVDDGMREIQMHFIIGYIYSIREMFELAEIEFKEVLKMGIQNAQLHSALGYIYHKRKDYDKAIYHLNEALKIDPANANAKNSLGFILIDSGGNIDDAIREIRDALDKDGENPAYFDSLGWAYYKKGDIANAKRYLTKAFELAPYHEEIKEHLRQAKQLSTR